MYIWIIISILHIILHGCLTYLIPCYVTLHGIYIVGIFGLYFGGGSYSLVYVPPPMCVFHNPCNVYPCSICLLSVLLYSVCIFLCPHIPLALLSANCVTFIHNWMKTFGVVYAYVFHHMQLNVYFEICLHNINYHI